MPDINRVRVAWTNWPGAPGLSTFYLASGTTDVTAIKTFFSAIAANHPTGLLWTIPSTGDIIDSGTNKITGTWVGTGGGQVSATATSAPYSGTSGAMVRWISGAVVDGHRLTGRTYLVPLAGNKYANDGSLDNAAQSAIQTAANTLVSSYAGNLLVYHKPRNASGGDPGSPAVVSGAAAALVPDLAVVLRSRRV